MELTTLEFALMTLSLVLGAMCYQLWTETQWLHEQLLSEMMLKHQMLDDDLKDINENPDGVLCPHCTPDSYCSQHEP